MGQKILRGSPGSYVRSLGFEFMRLRYGVLDQERVIVQVTSQDPVGYPLVPKELSGNSVLSLRRSPISGVNKCYNIIHHQSTCVLLTILSHHPFCISMH